MRLVDDTFAFIAQPRTVAQDDAGRWLVADLGDKDVKVYTAAGQRVQTIGGAGIDSGQFIVLEAALPLGDSIVTLDAARQRIGVFDREGRLGRTMDVPPPAIGSIRVLDDSLLLYIARVPVSNRLLRIVRRDGRELSSFMSRPASQTTDPLVTFHTHLLADGARGIVTAGLAGGDSLFAFDYQGRLLAAGLVDDEHPLRDLTTLLSANGGRARLRDGAWYFDGARFLFRIVAGPDSMVYAFIAPYDTRRGTDFVEGGTVLRLALTDGTLRSEERIESPWGLLGRDRDGRPVFLGYADSTHRRFIVSRDLISRAADEAVAGGQP